MGSSTSTPVTQATKQLVREWNQTHKVVVYSKSYCPHSRATKALLTSEKIPFQLLELDQRQDGAEIQSFLIEEFQHKTVPAIFINQKLVGGNSDLQSKFKRGELKGVWNDFGNLVDYEYKEFK